MEDEESRFMRFTHSLVSNRGMETRTENSEIIYVFSKLFYDIWDDLEREQSGESESVETEC